MFIVKLLIILTVVILVWDYSTRWLIDPYDPALYFGVPGCGKTTVLTKLSIKYRKHGFNQIYSTAQIPGTIYIPDLREQFGKCKFPPESLVLVDEANFFFDNREFATLSKAAIRQMRALRHDHVKIIFFSQTWNDLDKKVKSMVMELWYCRKFARCWTFSRRIWKKIKLSRNNKSDDSDDTDDIHEGYKWSGLIGGCMITFIPRWIPLFDSYVDLLPNRSDPKGVYIDYSEDQAQHIENKSHRKAVIRKMVDNTWGKRFEYLASLKNRFSRNKKK